MDANVLKPLETEESLCVFGIWLQLKNEEIEAEKAMEPAISVTKSAEQDLLRAQSAGLSGRSLSRIEQKLSAAKSKLAATIKSLEWIIRRRNLIGDYNDETKSYRIAKDDTEDQSIFCDGYCSRSP